MTTYRLAAPADEAALLALWVAANPGTTPDAWRTEYARIPERWAHTYIAVAADGMALSAALFWPRMVRDAQGQALRVGNLSHVATHPEARRQGHARRLVEMTIDGMRAEGCVWSYLTTSEAGRALYEQLGWRSVARPVWQGITSVKGIEADSAYTVRRYKPAEERQGWDALAQVYSAFNEERPLTLVRDEAYWHSYFAAHLSAWQDSHTPIIFAASNNGESEVRGYAIVYYAGAEAAQPLGLDQLFTASELCVLPEDEAVIPALLGAATRHAGGERLGGRVYAPRDAQMDAAIQQLFGHTAHLVEELEPMARPIAPDFGQSDLEAIFAAPGAISWPLDEI